MEDYYFEHKNKEAENKITRWMQRYNGDLTKVTFLVEDELHFSRSPGKRKAYQEWLDENATRKTPADLLVEYEVAFWASYSRRLAGLPEEAEKAGDRMDEIKKQLEEQGLMVFVADDFRPWLSVKDWKDQ